MGSYFPKGSTVTGGGGTSNPLVTVLQPLSPKGKQAMFAAANSGLIARRSWDGCAFNAGSQQLGGDVKSIGAAAEFFDTTHAVVARFIHAWDSIEGSDEACTQQLREALETVGLFTDPNESRVKRVIRGYVYKSEQTRMREEFDALVAQVEDLNKDFGADASPEAYELLNNAQKVGELLST